MLRPEAAKPHGTHECLKPAVPHAADADERRTVLAGATA